MKQLLLILITVILCASLLYADGTKPPGSGTSGDKYLVSTLDHLLWISTNSESWGSYFTQTANIDAAATAPAVTNIPLPITRQKPGQVTVTASVM